MLSLSNTERYFLLIFLAIIPELQLQESMFADGLDELDDARDIVHNLIEEYKACEKPDYADWGSPASSTAGISHNENAAPGQNSDLRMPLWGTKQDD